MSSGIIPIFCGFSNYGKDREKILSAAIRLEGRAVYTLPAPARHHNIIRLIRGSLGPEPDVSDQGFLTTRYRYVDRSEARSIALRSGQIIGGTINANDLFSEDVW